MYSTSSQVQSETLIRSDADIDWAYLQLLIEHSTIAIVALNQLHRVERCNPTFGRVFGFTRAEIVSRDFDEMIACGDMLVDARGYI